MDLWARRFEVKEVLLGSRAVGLSSLRDAWAMWPQLPAFSSGQCFGWEGTPGAVEGRAGLAEGGRGGFWVFSGEQALRQKPAVLPKLCSFCI